MTEYDRPPITFSEANPTRERVEYDKVKKEQSTFIGTAAKLALIGIGTEIISRKVLKTDLLSYAAHYMGRFYDKSYLAISKFGRAVRSDPRTGIPGSRLSYVDIHGEPTLAPGRELNIVRYVGEAREVMASPHIEASIDARIRLTKEALERKFSIAVPHFYDESLQRLQISNILEDQQQFIKHFGANQFKAIKEAVGSNILKRDFVVDENIFVNKAGKIIDARFGWRNPKQLIQSITKNINPLGIFRAVNDILDKPGFAVMPASTKVDYKTTIHNKANIYAFGDVFTFQNRYEYSQVELGKKIHAFKAGGLFHTAVAATTGQIRVNPANQATFWGKLQNAIGIGPAFKSHNSNIFNFLIRPFKSALGQGLNDSVLKIKPIRSSGKPQSATTDLIISQLGYVSDDAARSGAYALPPLSRSLSDYSRKSSMMQSLPFMERMKIIFDKLKAKLGFQSEHFALYKKVDVEPLHDVATPRAGGLPKKESMTFHYADETRASIDSPFDLYAGKPKEKIVKEAYEELSRVPEREIHRIMGSEFDTLSVREQEIRKALEYVRPTQAGGLSTSIHSKYGFATTETLFKAFPNFLTLRLNSLLGATAGIGIRPGPSALRNMAKIAAIPVIGLAGIRGVDYVDYLMQRWTGFSPLNFAAGTYATAREYQQDLRRAVGLEGIFEKTEKIAPGFLESGLGYLVRHGIIAGTSLALMLKSMPGAALTALFAGYTAIGGPKVAQSPEEIRAEYSGERLVPVRKSQLWFFGRQPLEGGRVDYYTASWYQKLKKRPGTVDLYGSRKEYYSKYANVFGIPFPTPESLFGLKQLNDPYALEKKHYYDRPYPVTAGMFDQFPVVGTLLNETIGNVIKPRLRMHPEMEDKESLPIHNVLFNQHLPFSAGEKLGFGSLGNRNIDVAQGGSLTERLDQLTNQLTEPVGFYKFIAEKVMKVMPERGFTEATASALSSPSRSFYDLQMGGMFGFGELWRRFFLPEFGQASKLNELVNPIANTNPDWLPGEHSRFMRDKSPWIDFHKGDAKIRVQEGETRLPGAGYEKLFGLHSGSPGHYDDIDRFLLLSQIAPFSEGYSYYKARVMNKYDGLDSFWKSRVSQALEIEEQKRSRYDYQERLFTNEASVKTNILDFRKDIGDLNKGLTFNGYERFARAGWEILSHDIMQNIPYVGTKLAPSYSPVEHYQKFQLYGSESAQWDSPWADIVRPAIYESAAATSPMAAIKGAALGALLSVPGSPFRAFNPFPEGSFLNSTSIIRPLSLAGSLAGITRKVATGFQAGGFTPPHVEEQREAEEYFDYIRYIKARIGEEKALEAGDEDMVSAYRREASSTFAGLTSSSNPRTMRRTMSRIDRAYFDAFSSAPAAERPAVLSSVPGYVGEIYKQIWGAPSKYDRTREEADEEAMQYMQSHNLPGPDNIIWHPDVPMQAIKAAYLDTGINGISDSFSKFDVYPQTIRETRSAFPDIYDSVPATINHGLFSDASNAISSFLNPFHNMRGFFGHGYSPNANISIYDSSPRKYHLKHTLSDR